MNAKGNTGVALATALGIGLAISSGVLAHGGYGFGPRGGHMMGGYGYGMHGPGGYGRENMPMMDECPGFGQLGRLDLTQAQRDELATVRNGLRKQHWELQGKLQDQYARLQELQGAQTPDKGAIDATYDEIFKLQRQLVQATTDAQASADKVLTQEQRKAVGGWHRGGPGPCVTWND